MTYKEGNDLQIIKLAYRKENTAHGLNWPTSNKTGIKEVNDLHILNR